MNDKRIAFVKCSREWLENILFKSSNTTFLYWQYWADSHKYYKFPTGLKVIGVDYSGDYDCFKVVVESSDFKPVMEGGIVPQIEVTFNQNGGK